MMRKTLGAILCVLILASCQKLKPASVQISGYPDFNVLMVKQINLLRNSSINKEVWLNGKKEKQVLAMDSASWAEELSFFKEINPNQSEYVGAFEKTGDELNSTLTLAKGEKGVLKKISFTRNKEGYEKINVSFHEDKDIYVHHREIALKFEKGRLNSFLIDGYQKMMFKDTVRFKIVGEVL